MQEHRHPTQGRRVPTGKTFDAWNDTTSSIPAPTQAALRTLEWIGNHENLVICGPSGTGKTHFLEALGHAAVDAGAHVLWFSLEQLGQVVRRHRADDTTGRALRRILRADLILIDDIGLLPVAADTAEALYRIVDAAYEKRSIALSSNLHPAGFDELMPKTIANATVDRLLHHAHLVATTGDSIRLHPRQGRPPPHPMTNPRSSTGRHRALLLAATARSHWPPARGTRCPLTTWQLTCPRRSECSTSEATTGVQRIL